MGTEIYLGKPPADVEQWIKDHYGSVVKETTVVKYTAESGLPDWEGDIVGQLTSNSIPNKSNIAEVVIGSHVTSISSYAFMNCSNLTNITIPDSVTSIGSYAITNCAKLTNVTMGNGVTSIGALAFSSCGSLTSIIISNNVTSIEMSAFSICSSLMSVTFSGKDKATVQGMSNYSWDLPSGCVLHCADGDITL